MNEDKRTKAIRNNEALYASVFKAHGIELQKKEHIYFSTKKVPPLNSNICTKSPMWRPDDAFEEINKTAHEEGWESWSIKDSFACLSLQTKGFEKHFDAQWLYLEHARFTALPASALSFKKVQTPEELKTWVEVWGENEGFYIKSMLEDSSLSFVIGYENDQPKYAVLLNTSDDVIGVSNFFPKETTKERWSDLILYIHETWGPIDVVGYERNDVLTAIAPLGVGDVGNLTIWIKK